MDVNKGRRYPVSAIVCKRREGHIYLRNLLNTLLLLYGYKIL